MVWGFGAKPCFSGETTRKEVERITSNARNHSMSLRNKNKKQHRQGGWCQGSPRRAGLGVTDPDSVLVPTGLPARGMEPGEAEVGAWDVRFVCLSLLLMAWQGHSDCRVTNVKVSHAFTQWGMCGNSPQPRWGQH